MAEKGKVLFITVGTTALSAKDLGLGWNDFKRFDAFKTLREKYLENAANNRVSERDLLKTGLLAHRALWEVDNGRAILDSPDCTSAEMTSTYLLTAWDRDGVPGLFAPRRDRFVLLTSDTFEGKLCARINARLMHEFLFAPERHEGGLKVTTPRCRCKALETDENPCDQVTIEVVKGLEAKKFGGDVSGQVTRYLDKHSAGRSAACNITGGYKGTIPAVTLWVSQRGEEGRPLGVSVPIYYQHLSSRQTVRVTFIPDPENPGQQQVRDTLVSPPPSSAR